MKLTPAESFEIQAIAYYTMTGKLAPGKDISTASYSEPFEERERNFKQWLTTYDPCIRAMLAAFECMF
jgi:hypothetical protein